jgi:hypothetical protein
MAWTVRRPDSRLSLRLRAVQSRIQATLDDCPPDNIRVVSLCAGQVHDLLGVLQHHVRRDDVQARLVEFDEHNAAIAEGHSPGDGAPAMCATMISSSRYGSSSHPTQRLT